MEASEPENVPFHKKPIYYWLKSFAEREIQREDSFSKFLGSSALTNALEYLGVTNEGDQSSLHLSVIFDEDNSGTFSRKSYNQFESETKSRIQHLNRIFNELTSHFEDSFSQLVTIRPPDTVHIATACLSCSGLEFEKVLLLLFGAAIKGEHKHDTIRRIKGFPSDVQESLIATIKMVTDSPEVIDIIPWSAFSSADAEEQRKIYDRLLSIIRRIILERNSAIQTQLLSDYYCGYTNCDQKRTYETKSDSDLEKTSDDNRTNAALRQLREELLEKSDLLQECREELEMTKKSVEQLQEELAKTQQELKNCKKSRDEYDVLLEGQEKALRLEAELQKMRKKLENSEQYFERIEILQSENRNFQLKHAILMDQINMLTVDKERLEVSFMIQNHHRSHDLSDQEIDDHAVVKSLEIKEELLMDSDEDFKPNSALAELESPNCPQESDFGKSENNINIQEVHSQSETPKSLKPSNSKRCKTRYRRASGFHVKRTRKALFTPTRIGLPKVTATSPPEETYKPSQSDKEEVKVSLPNKKIKSKNSKALNRDHLRRRSENQTVPHLDLDNDADEELSLSPNPKLYVTSSSSSSDNEITTENLIPQLPRRPSIIEAANNETGTESDNEFFFVCSATAPPTSSSRNIKIASGTQLQQIINGRKQSDGGSDVEEDEDLGNCNIHVNLRHVNSHNLNLSHGHSPSQTLIAYRTVPANALVNKIQTYAASPGCNPDSSSEDDDSVWYEYGCV